MDGVGSSEERDRNRQLDNWSEAEKETFAIIALRFFQWV
jgi:hypothetical protein